MNKKTDTPDTADVEPAEVERIEQVVLDFDPDPHFARGDCRDAMLGVLRVSMDWSKLGEQRQRDINAAVDQAAETIIAKLVRALAGEGRETIVAKLEQMTVKDGIKLVLTTPFDHDALVTLGELQGGRVSIVDTDMSSNDHERAAAQVDPDQPELPEHPDDDSDLVNAADEATEAEPVE